MPKKVVNRAHNNEGLPSAFSFSMTFRMNMRLRGASIMNKLSPKCLLSVLCISVMLLSSLATGYNSSITQPSQATNDSIKHDRNTLSQNIENGTNVWWESYDRNSTDQFEYDERNWVFSPYPEFSLYHSNGSKIDQDSYIEIQQWTRISVEINKSLFVNNAELGNVTVTGKYKTASPNFVAQFQMGYNRFGNTSWWADSYQFNLTEQQELANFVEIDTASCVNTSNSNSYNLDFWINMTQDAPLGLYELTLQVFDDSFVSVGYYEYDSNWQFNGVAVGMSSDAALAVSLQGSYTFQKQDPDGNPIYSIDRGQEFITRFNITGAIPSIVQLGIYIPEWMSKLVNQTDYHSTMLNDTRGWIYNETSGTFEYDENANVVYTDELYGVFEKDEELYRPAQDQVETYKLQWNPHSKQWDVITETKTLYQELFYIYNASTDSFETYFGYSYYGISTDHYVPGVMNHETSQYYPVPDDVPEIFNLNSSLCKHYTSGDEEIFEFGGHFTELYPVSSSRAHFEFDDRVIGQDGNQYSSPSSVETAEQTEDDYTREIQYAIESPIVSAELLTESGTEPSGWFFHASKAENHTVRAQMEGGANIVDEIDSTRLILRSYRDYWKDDEQVKAVYTFNIEIAMNGTPSFSAYNKTWKRNYTYGSYEGWSYEEIEGWHYIYNSSSGEYELIYGTYNKWMYVEQTEWHWQTWYFNQKTERWQMSEIREISEASRLSIDFASIYNFTYWTEGLDLHTSFLVEFTESIPDGKFSWSVEFSKTEWYIDEHVPTDYYDRVGWAKDWVYSFSYQSNQLIMEPFINGKLAYYNDTLCNNENVDYLVGDTTPYITINGVDLPLKVDEIYQDGSLETSFFHYEPDNPDAISDYYYELSNGTKIYVQQEKSVGIYNVTLGNGDSFLCGSYNPMRWKLMYSFIDTNGVIHQGLNEDIYNNVTYELLQQSVIDEANREYYIRYGQSGILNLSEYWTWDSRAESWFMVDSDGTPYTIDYNQTDYRYYATVNGTYQRISWPISYFVVQYDGNEIILTPPTESKFWFYEDDGTRYEMPYPGANAEHDGHLSRIVGDSGKVPTFKTLEYAGDIYPVYNISTDYFVDISSQTYLVEEYNLLYSEVNDTDIWDPTVAHYTVYAGNYNDEMNFDLFEVIPVNTSSPEYSVAEDLAYYQLLNGTKWAVNYTVVSVIKEYNLDGKSFYSFYDDPIEMDNGTHQWNAYPAINGTLFNSTDWAPLPVVDTFLVHQFENSSGYYFEFMSEMYQWDTEGGFEDEAYIVLNATYTGQLFLWGEKNYKVYQFDYQMETVNATRMLYNVYRERRVWGRPLIFGPQSIAFSTYHNFGQLVIGTPDIGLWGIQKWTVNPDNGALDIDGDLDTTTDQYYIMGVYESTQQFTHHSVGLNVHINWEPNTTLRNDEFILHSYVGIDEFTWNYEWNQSYIWYHADDMTLLEGSEIEQINQTFFNTEGERMPGYWDISHLVRNVTWEDIIQEAIERGWDWVQSNEEKWVWLSFGIVEDYGTSYMSGDFINFLDIEMRYEFSGLMVWEDFNENRVMDVNVDDPGSGELSHYLIPRTVDDVSFIRPGEAYGWDNETGELHLELNDTVTWGITYHGINGTLIPFTLKGYFGWFDKIPTGTDAQSFEDRPSKVSVDELSFVVNFQGIQNTTEGSLNNLADVKVDNYVGNWDVDMVGGRDNLENKSLGLNYFAEIGITEYSFKANGTETDQESTAEGDIFEIESAGAKFAEMIMGGVTYDWGKNTTSPYDVTSHTTPHKTFRIAYESDSGRTAASWNITTKMFYVTIGFPEWEGYSVYQDPVFVGYSSSQGLGPVDPVQFGVSTVNPEVPEANQPVRIEIDITSSVEYSHAELIYWTVPSEKFFVGMTEDPTGHFEGMIPGYEDNTQVFYQIVLHTELGDYYSEVDSYIVGQGVVTVTTTTTTPTIPSGTGVEVIVLVIGIAAAVVVIGALIYIRKR